MPLDQVRVSVLDRAFLFGDAVYEALRVYRGRLWLCREHMERLARSLAEIRIACDIDRLERRMLETRAHSAVAEGLIYIQVTRGEAPRSHRFPNPPAVPNELIYVADLGGDPHAAVRESGVAVITHPDNRWERRDIKSVNLLGNCLASQAAAEAGCYEAILVEPDGKISEATHNSVFAVKDGTLLTAPKSHHILPGITRDLVLALCRKSHTAVAEAAFHKEDLATIDELFLTGTTTEVLAVTKVDGRCVGNGKPGPVTVRLAAAYRAAIDAWLAGK
jgi:D-alanine transaminase